MPLCAKKFMSRPQRQASQKNQMVDLNALKCLQFIKGGNNETERSRPSTFNLDSSIKNGTCIGKFNHEFKYFVWTDSHPNLHDVLLLSCNGKGIHSMSAFLFLERCALHYLARLILGIFYEAERSFIGRLSPISRRYPSQQKEV
jgi:hypothetical protein